MPTFKVNVKWGKEKFKDVEVNTDEVPMIFKAQLFALSNVPPDRQKVMMKGSVLKDDDWGKIKLKDGATLLLMGTADELPQAPTEKVLFVEDMTDQQLAKVMEMPPGLSNLGNTCYMNATLQCLRSVPELKQVLKQYTGTMGIAGVAPADQTITAAIRELFENMEQAAEAFPPIVMLRVLHMCFPQFAEKSEHGGFQQQDANECWTELVRCLQKRLPPVKGGGEIIQSGEAAATSFRKGFIDQYFGGEFSITMKCVEAEDEAPSVSSETFYQLSCFIEKEVKYMHTGLKNRLEEHITKRSEMLGRDAQYHKICKINRLPNYLTIQMVRFYYKEKESINAKILKDVKFPLSLDVYDLCTEELQKKLVPARDKFKAEEDKKAEAKLEAAKKAENATKTGEEVVKKMRQEPYTFEDDPGANNSGYYELQAVLTHKGRSSSSGHYVGWVRRKGDDWLMFDDDNVSPVKSEDILKLSGGGDWHCAYVMLYGPKILEVEEEDETEKGSGDVAKTPEANEKPMDTS